MTWQRVEKADLDAIRARLNVIEFMAKHVKDMADKGSYSVAFHNENTPSFTIWPDHFNCFGCGANGDMIDAAMRLDRLTFLEAVDKLRQDASIERRLTAREKAELERQRKERERKMAAIAAAKLRSAKRIIGECVPSAETGVTTYLAARGLPLRQPIADLLFHPSLDQWEQDPQNPKKMVAVARWPAMVGIVRNKAGQVIGLHRTYLVRDCARKAPIDRPKRMLGECTGGAVRLGPPASKIGTCEGIETGIAFQAERNIPTWYGLNTSGLAAMELPDLPIGSEPIIGADNDSNGAREKAARKAIARWIAECRRPSLVMPDEVGTDFADMFAAKRRVEVAA